MKRLLDKIFFHSWKKYIILFVVGCVLTMAGLLLNGFNFALYYVNSFFFAGFAMICLGGLSIVNYYGGYDFMSYAFSKRNPDGTKIQYSTYIENKENKRKNNKLPFGPYFVRGTIFLIVSIIIYCVIF